MSALNRDPGTLRGTEHASPNPNFLFRLMRYRRVHRMRRGRERSGAGATAVVANADLDMPPTSFTLHWAPCTNNRRPACRRSHFCKTGLLAVPVSYYCTI
jgi:hypothetical protein